MAEITVAPAGTRWRIVREKTLSTLKWYWIDRHEIWV